MLRSSLNRDWGFKRIWNREGHIDLFRNTRNQNSIYKCSLSKSLAIIGEVALLIIACLAAAGKFPTPKLGWTVIGLGSALLIPDLIFASQLKNKKVSFWVFAAIAAYITLGALGGIGIISAKQVGHGLLGTIGVSLVLGNLSL